MRKLVIPLKVSSPSHPQSIQALKAWMRKNLQLMFLMYLKEKARKNILITMLSLVTQLTMSYPGSHFGSRPTLQATLIKMHLDYLPKNHKP